MSEVIDRVTRANIDQMLDHNRLEMKVRDAKAGMPERWWSIRRNSATWHGRRDKHRIKISVKAGLSVYRTITELDFLGDGTLNPAYYRIKIGV